MIQIVRKIIYLYLFLIVIIISVLIWEYVGKYKNIIEIDDINEGFVFREPGKRIVEKLDRGIVAISSNDGIFITWRVLGTENEETIYELYRDGELIYVSENNMSTSYLDTEGNLSSEYYIVADYIYESEKVTPYLNQYFDINIKKPNNNFTPIGKEYTYFPGDASCGDLDGDGEYEIILKWDPSNSKDNSQDGYTGNVILDAYKLDGTLLWRIDLGINIRAGAHYTPFLVYDFDCDGDSEVVCRTSDGTIDSNGKVIGDNTKDYRDKNGRILAGNEYLTVFDGMTGKEIVSIDYEPARGWFKDWGDDVANRSDRFLAAVAYLDGTHPSIIMCRGYYTRVVVVAYNFDGKTLTKIWTFDSNQIGCEEYAGQGNHNLCIADVDEDGYDEIVYGQCCIDHDGTGLWNTKLGHGDLINVGDFLPEQPGLEVWGCLEDFFGVYLADAKTGEIIYKYDSEDDVGRAVADNLLSGNNSAEFFFETDYYIKEYVNNAIKMFTEEKELSINFTIWWTGNLERCGLDKTTIYTYGLEHILEAQDVVSINGTKANPCLTADILGDWREEIIFAKEDGDALRIYISDYETEYRIYTLMHNTMYRCGVANENVGHNISPRTEFFIDSKYELPSYPNIEYCN